MEKWKIFIPKIIFPFFFFLFSNRSSYLGENEKQRRGRRRRLADLPEKRYLENGEGGESGKDPNFKLAIKALSSQQASLLAVNFLDEINSRLIALVGSWTFWWWRKFSKSNWEMCLALLLYVLTPICVLFGWAKSQSGICGNFLTRVLFLIIKF